MYVHVHTIYRVLYVCIPWMCMCHHALDLTHQPIVMYQVYSSTWSGTLAHLLTWNLMQLVISSGIQHIASLFLRSLFWADTVCALCVWWQASQWLPTYLHAFILLFQSDCFPVLFSSFPWLLACAFVCYSMCHHRVSIKCSYKCLFPSLPYAHTCTHRTLISVLIVHLYQ